MNVRLSAAIASVAALGLVFVSAALGSPGSKAEATDLGIVGAGAGSSWQTNNVVYALAYSNGVVYLGGTFTSVRPPGAAPGTGEVARAGAAAFNSATGELLPWAPAVTSTNSVPNVEALAVSADGSTVYLGGEFTAVSGTPRGNLAAVSASSGALTSWAPSIPTGKVYAVTPVSDGTAVYIGGQFGVISRVPRTNAAATDAAGTVLPWAPAISGGSVRAISRSPDGSVVVLGGGFSTVNGVAHRGLMAVDPTAGRSIAAWGAGPKMSLNFQIYHHAVDANQVYVSGVDNGGGSEFDGTAAIRWADGSIAWADYCYGDTHGITVAGGMVYAGGHGHDCSKVPGGYPHLSIHQGMYAEAVSDGHMQAWFPKSNSADSSEQTGTRVMATDGTQVFAGGDFTKINEKPQQGFVRFPPTPDTTSPLAPAQPSAQANINRTATVSVTASYDRDDGTLTYTLYRDGTTAVATTSVTSRFWSQPRFSMTDPTPPVGSHYYTARASDGRFAPASPASNTIFIG